jgi:hypothetical protein
MMLNRAVRAILLMLAAASLAATSLSAPARADDFIEPARLPELPYRSAYLQWMATVEVPGRAAPIAIANKPCYVYEGSQLIVFPCPGAIVAHPYGGWVNSRY